MLPLVEVKDPLKQGLKPVKAQDKDITVVYVEVKDPLKQGLKPLFSSSFFLREES